MLEIVCGGISIRSSFESRLHTTEHRPPYTYTLFVRVLSTAYSTLDPNLVPNGMAYTSPLTCVKCSVSTVHPIVFALSNEQLEAMAILNRSSSGEPMYLKHLYLLRCKHFGVNAAGQPHCQCYVDHGPFGVTFVHTAHTWLDHARARRPTKQRGWLQRIVALNS